MKEILEEMNKIEWILFLMSPFFIMLIILAISLLLFMFFPIQFIDYLKYESSIGVLIGFR